MYLQPVPNTKIAWGVSKRKLVYFEASLHGLKQRGVGGAWIEASLHGLKQRGVGGGAHPPPPFANTMMGFQKNHMLEERGGGGVPPPSFGDAGSSRTYLQHVPNTMIARMMGFKKKKLMYFEASLHGLKQHGFRGGGAAPTICKHNARMNDGFQIQKGAYASRAGGWGAGGAAPPFANTMLAWWVSNALLWSKLARLKRARGAGAAPLFGLYSNIL